MTELSAMEPFDQDEEAVEDYRQQARDFLGRSWAYLEQDDLHQASEKGWAAGAWMVKAVAERHGWQFSQHSHFFSVARRCQELAGDGRIRNFTNAANTLHTYFYTRKRLLTSTAIQENLVDIEELLDVLEPLTLADTEAAD